MALMRMNQKKYADHWEEESNLFESKGIYKRLNQITPQQDTLEIGSGIGLTTQHLASTRKVLSIDNNKDLINKANARLAQQNLNAKIMEADIFTLSNVCISTIAKFSPKGIVCWFIGSHPDDVDKWTSSSTPMNEKSKTYRENIEDLLLSQSICTPSVEWIHLANRVGVIATATDDEIIEHTKDDYDTHLFSKSGFKVVDVQVIDWDTAGSSFMYINAPNPNLTPGQSLMKITSILAQRVT